MNIEYVARHVKLDDRIRNFVETKLTKVTKFLEEPVEIRVTLEGEKHRQIAEIHVAHRFGVLQATEETDDLLGAINLAVDKVEKQARRGRKKFMDQRRRNDRQGAHEWPVEVLDRDSIGRGGGPRIIKSSAFSVKPMTLDEAALQLESSENDFVVFRDAASERVSVLYKRRDRNYGLISPNP